jgi:hypothetical protein
MAEQRKARPVSGEIMTDAGRDTSAQPSRMVACDIIDADFEDVTPRTRRNESAAEVQPVFTNPSAPSGGMEMLRSASRHPDAGPVRGGPVFWIAGISLVVMAFWVAGGHSVMHAAAFPLSWQAQDLRLAEVNSRVDSSGRKPLLLVDGAAFNDGNSPAVLPPIDVAVVGNDGKTLRYRLGTGTVPVAPGASWAFSSRLEVPMNGIKTVTVAFSE